MSTNTYWWASIDAGPDAYFYVTAVGRSSGRRHTVELWFCGTPPSLYCFARRGWATDWLRNLTAAGQCEVGFASDVGEEASFEERRVLLEAHRDGLVPSRLAKVLVVDPRSAQARAARRCFAEKYDPNGVTEFAAWMAAGLLVELQIQHHPLAGAQHQEKGDHHVPA